MIKCLKIDDNGFLVFGHDLFINNGDQVPTGYTNGELPNIPFYKPRWTGTEWIEGKTKDEFLEDKFLESLNPSLEELTKAERELETIELLIEMGLI